jgi:diaminohydroxyphosphoribosylaminopyrimidine deaminase/5-amino-6-(5-phosphoribosylamino)uracil reductase
MAHTAFGVGLYAPKGFLKGSRLMVEGGPTIAAAFVDADLVDEAALFRSLRTIGADGIDALQGLPLDALTQFGNLVRTSKDAIGADSIEFFSRR